MHYQLLLAPMAGVTDVAFRELCCKFGAVATCSEMVSAQALVYQDAKSKTLLARGNGEKNYSVQLFGHVPSVMAVAAVKAFELAAPDAIDINMGCPTGKIVRNGDGCSLMRSQLLASEIIRAVVSAVPCPVTVKFRKGWDNGSVNAVDFAKMCEDSGAAAIAVHGRTCVQQYSGVADRDIIKAVRDSVSIPVTANGDVFTPADAQKMYEYTGCDRIMVGRGAMGNPWIFSGKDAPRDASERLNVALRQIERAAELKGERVACLEARKHIAWYLRGLPYVSPLKQMAAKAVCLDDIRRIVNNEQ